MAAAGVPTARAFVCTTAEEAAAALDELGAPYVVKDDGLAAGKGVVVTDSRDEALAHAAACARVVIEEYLDGPEVSLFAITDGSTVYPLQPAQDFKRIFDGDEGPNTGGMGAYTPLPWAPPGLVDEVLATVLQPTVDELARRGTPFSGLLYAGLALTSRGVRVIEFNVRFGDPETQPLLALLESPLGELLMAAATGTLSDVPAPVFADGAAVAVVMASRGYPASSSSGDVDHRRRRAPSRCHGVHVFHAGTALRVGPDGDQLVTAGGRVLAVVGTGSDVGGRPRRGVRRGRLHLLRRRAAPHRHRGGPSDLRARRRSSPSARCGTGRSWLEHPVVVESDEGPDGVLAVVLADGAPFTFPPHPGGPHPWSGRDRWLGATALQLRRPDDWYSVWKFFSARGEFECWYVNFERPLVRTAQRHRHRRPRARPGGAARRRTPLEGRRAPRGPARPAPVRRRRAGRRAPRRRRRHRPAGPRRPLVVAVGRLEPPDWALGVLDQLALREQWRPVTVPNVLATRYAGADLAEIWSPEHKIVLERQLWIAVLKAQRDLGVDVPDGVVEAYEDVVDKVDLDSIAARERVTRHDVKARIEEFSALAGHEHIHKGMT